jgi:hypothetical protein
METLEDLGKEVLVCLTSAEYDKVKKILEQ